MKLFYSHSILLICVLLVPTYLFGQFSDARISAMGDAGIALERQSVFFGNPAQSCSERQTLIGFSYHNRFLLSETQTQSLYGAAKLGIGTVSAGIQTYGSSLFRQTITGLGYSLLLSKKCSAGIQINSADIRLPNYYGHKRIVYGNIGLLTTISDNINLAFVVGNIYNFATKSNNELPVIPTIKVGSCYRFSKILSGVIELEKDLVHSLRLKTGVEYFPLSKLSIRCGIKTFPSEMSFGTGMNFKKINLDIASIYTPLTGWSTGITFLFTPKQKARD